MLIPIVLIGIFLLRRMRRYFPDWTSKKDKIGEIEFKEQILKFDNFDNQINYSDVKKINFRYNFIKGRNFTSRDIIHNGLAELKITTNNSEIIKFKFIVESEEQFKFLKSVFKYWYKQGIEIREEFTNQKIKTVCLEVIGNKSYTEIQKLKNEIKKEASR
jgi:hypothetical protein